MAKYSDFKSYIQDKYAAYLLRQVSDYVNKNHDGQGFHTLNVLSICDQKVDNLSVKSLRCTDMPDPFVKIAVNLTADIITMGLGTKKYEADRKTRWFTVTIVACLRDGMEIKEDQTTIEEYAPGTWDKTTALDEFGVPYVYAADLEDIADDFFEFYCQDAIYHMYNFPYGHVMQQLGIYAYEAELPENTMGRMYFKKDKATVYRKFHPYFPERKIEDEDIEPGTMLISKDNYFMHKTGCYMMTIAHEIVHWYYHQKFFKILSLLDDSLSVMNCEVEPQKYDSGMTSLQKAMWFVEWQANSIGMRIAMPQALFVQAVQEAYDAASKIPRKGCYWAEVVEDTIHRVACLFDVSDFAAKQRAIQLGWDVAAGTHIYVDGRKHAPFFFKEGTLGPKQSFVIDKAGLEKVRSENVHIKELLDSEQFIYLGYVVCAFDEKYVREATDDEKLWNCSDYELTDYAREHVDECCLIFDWESISGGKDDGGFYGQCYLSKDITVDNRIEHAYDPFFENNQSVEEMAKAAADYKAMYAEEERILSETPNNFSEALIYHMDRKHVTVDDLAATSGLSTTTIKKYRAGKVTPNIDNIMAVFIGMNLGPAYCEDLLDLAEISLSKRTDKGRAYKTLIQEYTDGSLDQWNAFLKEYGLESIPNKRNQ
ncbi:helix-turn-helix domain-containing protein [Acetivibrio ethanolgignens]|uniref:Uncharacterized protein n=1 Tax=Acetivibrio ethanolgignens TaxID=290052 RepID=A0A0V8QC89_9FIRM|nr:helix-turn-helix transcriptional regulator [Acetivibrio ethanolgignens]KSV58132.1 hypothetical protein ASU35_14150 [Acetivibrio ethanolgignens]